MAMQLAGAPILGVGIMGQIAQALKLRGGPKNYEVLHNYIVNALFLIMGIISKPDTQLNPKNERISVRCCDLISTVKMEFRQRRGRDSENNARIFRRLAANGLQGIAIQGFQEYVKLQIQNLMFCAQLFNLPQQPM